MMIIIQALLGSLDLHLTRRNRSSNQDPLLRLKSPLVWKRDGNVGTPVIPHGFMFWRTYESFDS